MREKYIKLIVALQEQKSFIKGNELAKRLGVSDRTIRSYIKDLNDNYLIDAKIKNNKNKGYILTGTVNEIKRTQQIEFEERAFFIIKYLLEKENWVTYDELAEALLFSSQTIRTDVLKIQQMINNQLRAIKVESIIFQGIRLVGSEIDKRLFLDSLSNPPALTNINFTKLLSHYFKDWTTLDELETLVDYLKNQIDQLDLPTNTDVLLPIISYLIICLKRIESAYLLEDATELLTKYDIKKTKEYQIAKKLLGKVSKQKQILINESEIIYFSFYLMSQRLLFVATNEEESYIPDMLKKDVLEVLTRLEEEYQMKFCSDTQLSSGLILHLSRDIYPLLFNFYIENSLITTIKQEYIQAYYISVRFSHLISKQLCVHVPESEIGYLALHFASYLERKKRSFVSAAIVSGRNQSISVLLKKDLEKQIPALEITEIITFEKISSLSPNVQLLISSFPLKSSNSILTIKVNEFITEKDVRNLTIMVNKILSKNIIKIDYFSRTKLRSKEQIIKSALSEMKLEYMFESCIERERLTTTEVGNGVAIPHPLHPSNEKQMKIGVIILDKKIVWGSSEVQIIFFIVPGRDKQSEMSQVMEELHRIVNDKGIISRLLKAKSKEECATIF
ncbi:PRD domain-containing protein [Enterococcus faecium]|uniref:BglG family transcription antiterminator n=1 Tax=Enterococcus faecium TaxID=1352 RepID=UPI0020906626|nr:PRD domain-containing protein [Enterococcus faecium]MCO5533466.1 PRD domain-containing protein [Enterococcus faecium]